MKDHEEKVSKDLEEAHRRQVQGLSGNRRASPVKGKNTPYPEDARPNPFLAKTYDDFNTRAAFTKKIDAHSKGIGGFALI